jgi:hypothetical protein
MASLDAQAVQRTLSFMSAAMPAHSASLVADKRAT